MGRREQIATRVVEIEDSISAPIFQFVDKITRSEFFFQVEAQLEIPDLEPIHCSIVNTSKKILSGKKRIPFTSYVNSGEADPRQMHFAFAESQHFSWNEA
jgi:hypothetical protein